MLISFSSELFVGTDSTYSVFSLCICMLRSNKTSVWRAYSPILFLLTIRPRCNLAARWPTVNCNSADLSASSACGEVAAYSNVALAAGGQRLCAASLQSKKSILFDWHIWFISSQALGASLRLLWFNKDVQRDTPDDSHC